MKVELKHLSGYLPYGLNLKINTPFGTFHRKFELDCGHDFNLHLFEGNVKPILRPISELSKNEFPFELGTYTSDFKFVLENTEFQFVSKMFELHFDVYGLIEKGLAIDINTLNK